MAEFCEFWWRSLFGLARRGRAGFVIYKMFPAQMAKYGGLAFNFYRSFDAPEGTLATEANPDHQGGATAQAAPSTGTPQAPAADADWPSYNRTLTSERYSPLSQINTENVGKLKVLCTYDVGELHRLRVRPDHGGGRADRHHRIRYFLARPGDLRRELAHPRGLSRRAFCRPTAAPPTWTACCFAAPRTGGCWPMTSRPASGCGKRPSRTRNIGETVPSAPIAWDGLVFVGNAGGDFKGGKGRMYALDAKTGKIVWEFFLVPKAEGDIVRGPLGAIAARPMRPGKTRPAYRSAAAEPGRRTRSTRRPGCSTSPAAIRRPTSRSASREGENLYYRLGRRPRRQDRRLQRPFQACAEGLARLGRLQPADPDQNDGRQGAHGGGRAEGRVPLRLRSRRPTSCSTRFR